MKPQSADGARLHGRDGIGLDAYGKTYTLPPALATENKWKRLKLLLRRLATDGPQKNLDSVYPGRSDLGLARFYDDETQVRLR